VGNENPITGLQLEIAARDRFIPFIQLGQAFNIRTCPFMIHFFKSQPNFFFKNLITVNGIGIT